VLSQRQIHEQSRTMMLEWPSLMGRVKRRWRRRRKSQFSSWMWSLSIWMITTSLIRSCSVIAMTQMTTTLRNRRAWMSAMAVLRVSNVWSRNWALQWSRCHLQYQSIVTVSLRRLLLSKTRYSMRQERPLIQML
jgi:hypothetical protein